ncbi:MAG: isoprenylcysteine carboxylmethyltransferase family protein [Nonlabens sp.]
MNDKKSICFVATQILIIAIYFIEIKAIQFYTSSFLGGFFFGFGAVSALLVLYALLQLNTKISPFPAPRNNSKLVTSGAYKFTRHPIYTGIFFSLFYYGIVVGSGFKIIVSILLLALFYYKSRYEETLLLQQFPDYAKYQQEVGQLIPYVGLKN